jgi:hypothetical protein
MSTSLDMPRVEVSISDPWEISSVVATSLHGTAMNFSGNSAIVRLDQPISIDGVALLFAIATPRHADVCFRQSGQPFASNIVLTADEPPPAEDREAATAQAPSVATIGTVSFNSCKSR